MSDTTQTQTQHQSQVISINVSNSGDPELEGRILNGAYGVGRQLGALAAVVDVLLASRAGLAEAPEAAQVIEKFRTMREAIAQQKRERQPARLVEQLQSGMITDRAESLALCSELRAWLDEHESKLSGGVPPAA